MKKINFNLYVYVKLTDKVIHKYIEDYNKQWIEYYKQNSKLDLKSLLKTFEEFKKQEENGYYKFQIWVFLEDFGKYFGFGTGVLPLEDGNLYFKTEDLEKV